MMRRRAIAAPIAALLLLLWAPAAHAGSRDAASTHTFLTATVRFLRIAIAREPREKAGLDELIGHVRSTCPQAVPANGTTAQQPTVAAFRLAGEEELLVAETDPIRRAAEAFASAISRLRWSEQALNRQIALVLRQERALLAVRSPDLCRQAVLARRWNFARTPPAVRTFVRHVGAVTSADSPGADELARRMKPLAEHRDLAAIKHVQRLQSRVDALLSRLFFSAGARLAAALFG